MVPPIKPPDERFVAYVKELNQDIGPEDIADETWISKLIEGVICDLPVIDLSLFKSLRTVEELIRFIRNETKVIDAIESLAIKMVTTEQSKKYKCIKNLSLARRLLNEGRKLDGGKKFNTALTKLNEAIVKCPFPEEGSDSEGDQVLSHILAARSSVLFNQSRFLESVYDGDAAIKFNYPTEEIAGILKRRIICLKRMDREDDFRSELKSIEILRSMPSKDRLVSDLIRTADRLSEEGREESVQDDHSEQKVLASFMLMDFYGCNYYLPSAVRSIKKEFSDLKGNLLKTRKCLEIGDPVIREEAFVKSIFSGYHETRCNRCMCEVRQRFYPCPGCDVVRYCSTDCQSADWSKDSGFHSFSCEHSMLFYGFSILQLVHDIFMARRRQQTINSNRNWINSYISWFSSFMFSNVHASDYDSFSSLASTFHSDPNTRLGFLFQSVLVTKILSIVHCQKSLDMDKVMFDLNVFVLKTMLTIECCKVRLPDYDLNQLCQETESDEEDTLQRSIKKMKKIVIKNYYGFAIFNTMALLNHSCDPNADYLTHGNQVYVFANRAIKANEEITISYGPKVDEDQIEDRKEMLLNNFGFVCSCDKCVE